MKKITCIIPAYNEEKNIWKILNISSELIWNELFEVIVINDNSIDNTKKIIQKYSNIIFIDNQKNLGKTKSVEKWVKKAKWEYILLLDADLLNLTKNDIIKLIEPIIKNKADVTFSFRKNSWPLFPFKKIDYCTWERIIKKKFLLEIYNKEKNIYWYWLEILMNKLIISNKLRLKVVFWKNVENSYHVEKEGFIKWWIKNLKIWRDILVSAWWILKIYQINIELKKLLVK